MCLEICSTSHPYLSSILLDLQPGNQNDMLDRITNRDFTYCTELCLCAELERLNATGGLRIAFEMWLFSSPLACPGGKGSSLILEKNYWNLNKNCSPQCEKGNIFRDSEWHDFFFLFFLVPVIKTAQRSHDGTMHHFPDPKSQGEKYVIDYKMDTFSRTWTLEALVQKARQFTLSPGVTPGVPLLLCPVGVSGWGIS